MSRADRLLADYQPIGLCAGGVMWVVWLATILTGTGTLDRNGQVIGTDHTAFHTAAVLMSRGRGEALFDYPYLAEFVRTQEEITGKADFVDPFRNPPLYAVPYRLTSDLPYLASMAVWAGISFVALVMALLLIRGRRIGWPLAWSLGFYPVFATISFGQNTLLSLGAFALVYRSAVAQRPFLAGLASGILLYKPQLLLGLGVWWLIDPRRHWKSLGGLAVATGIFVAASALLVPAESEDWLRKLPEIARYDRFQFFNMHNPRGFAELLTGNRPIGNVVGLAGTMIAITALVLFRRRHAADPHRMFAAAVFVTLWGSPHTMVYEWALVLLPALILWDRFPELRRSWQTWFAVAWIAMFVSTPLTKAQLDLAGIAVQVSVPVMAFLGWRAARVLPAVSGESETNPAGSPRTS